MNPSVTEFAKAKARMRNFIKRLKRKIASKYIY
jgi:cell fate (sporulation/competence/biofilm development) regulator YlbF (YheA/YmcA/DUF963 family)